MEGKKRVFVDFLFCCRHVPRSLKTAGYRNVTPSGLEWTLRVRFTIYAYIAFFAAKKILYQERAKRPTGTIIIRFARQRGLGAEPRRWILSVIQNGFRLRRILLAGHWTRRPLGAPHSPSQAHSERCYKFVTPYSSRGLKPTAIDIEPRRGSSGSVTSFASLIPLPPFNIILIPNSLTQE